MALLNRPLTEDEARRMLADWRQDWPAIPSLYDVIAEAMENPTPHIVRYLGVLNSTAYISPSQFYWSQGRTSPSDCEWHVPETEKWRR